MRHYLRPASGRSLRVLRALKPNRSRFSSAGAQRAIVLCHGGRDEPLNAWRLLCSVSGIRTKCMRKHASSPKGGSPRTLAPRPRRAVRSRPMGSSFCPSNIDVLHVVHHAGRAPFFVLGVLAGSRWPTAAPIARQGLARVLQRANPGTTRIFSPESVRQPGAAASKPGNQIYYEKRKKKKKKLANAYLGKHFSSPR